MNYTGDHQLNLIGKGMNHESCISSGIKFSTVALVTSASTAQGATIIRALLNSNANVLGIDDNVPHESTLSSKASHFQFLKLDLKNCSFEEVSGKVVEEVKRHFERDDVDFVVNVVGEGGGIETLERLHGLIGEMVGRGGLVLSVGRENREGEEELIEAFRAAASKTKSCGMRWNILLPFNIISDANHRFILDADERDALQKHMSEHEAKRKEGGYAREKEREVANLVLFFCTSAGSAVNGALVGVNGTCLSL